MARHVINAPPLPVLLGRGRLALATIFQNTNQNTLGLLVYQNSSKYFRFAIKRPPYFAFLTSKNGKGASRLFTGVSRRSVNQSWGGQSHLWLTAPRAHTHPEEKASTPLARSLLLPCTRAPQHYPRARPGVCCPGINGIVQQQPERDRRHGPARVAAAIRCSDQNSIKIL